MITQARLRELFLYDPETGIFTRKVTTSHNAKAGMQVGAAHNCGYLMVTIAYGGVKKRYLLHRLAWLYVYGRMPEGDIDHINHNRADNRISNLRDVSRKDNLRNSAHVRSKSSNLLGAGRRKSDGKWVAKIRVDGKRLWLGAYDTPEEASRAYIEAKKLHHQVDLTLAIA